MSNLKSDTCWKCDGSRRLRNNTQKDGVYIFGKITCDECEGSGKIDALYEILKSEPE